MTLARSAVFTWLCGFWPLLVFAQVQPRRVAVYPFDDRANTDKKINIGLKVADSLLSKLAETGSFTIVDREYLKQIAAEKNLKFDPNFNPTGAARTGLLGVVDILIVGQVDAFHASTSSSLSGNMLVKHTKRNGETSLKVTARLISIERGSILSAPSASSEQTAVLSESSNSVLIQGIDNEKATGNVDQALLKLVDKEVDDVTNQLAKAMNASISSLAPLPARSIKAKFVGLDDGLTIINKGVSAGVQNGDKFALTRLVSTGMKDPDTGRPIVRHKAVCDLLITATEESLATGKCLGGLVPQAGDEAVLIVP